MKWRAIIILTALVTITSTNVLADCAWILWHELQVFTERDSSQKVWTVTGTAKTFEQCVELREKTLADHFKELNSKSDNTPASEESILRGGSTIVSTMKHGRAEITYSCWPENRDPRH